jgi:radical SAM superfamily enzyme YgiQ (UPF0313 family)
MRDIERTVRMRTVQALDNRSIYSTFDEYAAPSGNRGPIGIVRPFAVLSKTTYSAPVTPPIGPAYLAAVLKRAGYDVSIVDAVGADIYRITRSPCNRFNFQGLLTEDIISRLDQNVRIVGVSLMFSQEWIEHRSLIRAIRAARPQAVIVAGGEHSTAMPEYILRDCPEINYIVAGEGEITFLELCHAILLGKSPDQIGGIAFIDDNGRYIQNGLSGRISSIDELPQPAWDLCPVENYFIDNWTMGIAMGRNMPILATRGCPYQCTFCSNPTMWTTRYLMRSPTDVVDEIEHLIEDYQANSIDFFDLTAIVKRDWIIEFCRILSERNICVAWQLPSGTRSEALDEQTLRAIYDAGCRYLVYAPESGSEETLRHIKKKLRLSRLLDSVRTALSIGHTVKVNFIIGFPHERLKNVFETLFLVCRLAIAGCSDCNIAMFAPYPGSELFNQLRSAGTIPELNDDYFRGLILQFDFTVSKSYTPHITGWQLVALRMTGSGLFYILSYGLRPARFVRLLRGLLRGNFQPSNLFEQRISDVLARRRSTKKPLGNTLAGNAIVTVDR